MPRWTPYLLTASIAGATAAVHLGVGSLALLPDVVGVGAVIAAGSAVAAMWGLPAALVAGVLAAVVVSGVPATRGGLDLLVTDAGAAVRTLAGAALPVFVGTVVSLRRQVRTHRDAAGRARYDALTGLLNRVALEARLDEWIAHGRETGRPAMFAVLFVDLDRFKVINDTYGHDVGDRLLVAIARLLRERVREDDLVARLGGDEFVVAMPGLRDRHTAGAIASTLVSLLAAPIEAAGRSLSISASIGIAVYPEDGEDVASLVTSADAAMYAVKSGGKNSFVFSDLRLRDRQARRLDIEQRLRVAVVDHRLQVAYQPQIDLSTGRIVSFEALLRWDDDVLGKVSPSEFVPIAEEAGLIVPIGLWLLREACFQARSWDEDGRTAIGLAVNVSTLQFRQADFVEQVETALRDSSLAPERLEVEVTESVLIDEFDVAVQALRRLHRLGVRTALDDFGTGYSSLAYLQRLPIHALKIDRSFVSSLALTSTGRAGAAVPIVDAIAAMGRTLGKTVVAEGVETAAQARYLQRIGVDLAQGYYFGKAVAPAEAHRLVRTQRARALADARAARRSASTAERVERIELLLD